MQTLDVHALRRKLVVMGYALLEVRGGDIIRSVYYDSLVAGSEADPLTLEQVAAFAA